MNFSMDFSFFQKEKKKKHILGILLVISLNLYVDLGSIVISTTLNLPVCEHRILSIYIDIL